MKMLSERTLIDDGKRFGDLTVGEIKTLNAVMERVMRIHQERMRLSEQAFDDVKPTGPQSRVDTMTDKQPDAADSGRRRN